MRLALAFVFLATPAFAVFPDNCLQAIARGNEKDVARYAEAILSTSFPYKEEAARKGEQCLLHYTGKEYRYSKSAQRFFLAEDWEAGEAAAAAEVEEKKRAREEQERAEAEQLEAAERVKREALERAEKALELAAMQETVRKALVVTRLGEACERLYATAPDETISNKLCFDYFFENGLPE